MPAVVVVVGTVDVTGRVVVGRLAVVVEAQPAPIHAIAATASAHR